MQPSEPTFLAVLQLPTEEVHMRIMGIGGHTSPVVGLAEEVPLHIDTQNNKNANFFIF
jgi:hypothetical protein